MFLILVFVILTQTGFCTAVAQKLASLAMETVNTTPDAFQQRMLQDRERWARLVKDRRISLD